MAIGIKFKIFQPFFKTFLFFIIDKTGQYEIKALASKIIFQIFKSNTLCNTRDYEINEFWKIRKSGLKVLFSHKRVEYPFLPCDNISLYLVFSLFYIPQNALLFRLAKQKWSFRNPFYVDFLTKFNFCTSVEDVN